MCIKIALKNGARAVPFDWIFQLHISIKKFQLILSIKDFNEFVVETI